MVEIPGPRSFGTASVPTGQRGIARIDTSARARGLDVLARGIQSFGQSAVNLHNQVVAQREKLQTQEANVALANFQFREALNYVTALENAPPGDLANFTQQHMGGYVERVREFRAGLPDHFRNTADMTLLGDYQRMYLGAYEFERQALATHSLQLLGETIDNTVMPSIQAAAAIGDPDQSMGAFRQAQQRGIDQINATTLTEREKEEQRRAWLRASEVSYANLIGDPARVQDILGFGEAYLDDQIVGVEGLGANPNSTAAGEGQFIEGTWMALVESHHPELWQAARAAAGDDETAQRQWILDMRDPAVAAARGYSGLGREMVGLYRQQNVQYLVQQGIPASSITPGTVYLAHFLGPAGAVTLLNAGPGAAIQDAVSAQAYRANQALWERQGIRTVADLVNWAEDKMGNAASNSTTLLTNIAWEDRYNLATAAGTELTRQQTAAASQQNDAYDSEREALDVAIQLGQASLPELADFVRKWQPTGLLTGPDLDRLNGRIDEYQGDIRDLASAVRRVGQGNLNPENTDDVSAVNAVWDARLEETGGTVMQLFAADPESDEATQARDEFFQWAGTYLRSADFMTSDIAGEFVGAMNHANPVVSGGAYQFLDQLVSGPGGQQILDSLPQAAQSRLNLYRAFAAGGNTPEAAAMLTQALRDAPPAVAMVADAIAAPETANLVMSELLYRQTQLDAGRQYQPPRPLPTVRDPVVDTHISTLPGLIDDIAETADMIYAAMVRRGDAPGEATYQDAFNMAAGGTAVDGVEYGGFTTVDGREVLVPTAIPTGEFAGFWNDLEEDLFELVEPGYGAAGQVLDERTLSQAIPIALGDGTYFLAVPNANGVLEFIQRQRMDSEGNEYFENWEFRPADYFATTEIGAALGGVEPVRTFPSNLGEINRSYMPLLQQGIVSVGLSNNPVATIRYIQEYVAPLYAEGPETNLQELADQIARQLGLNPTSLRSQTGLDYRGPQTIEELNAR